MSAEAVSVSNVFDIFDTIPLETSTLDTTEKTYIPKASVDLEFLLPADHDIQVVSRL